MEHLVYVIFTELVQYVADVTRYTRNILCKVSKYGMYAAGMVTAYNYTACGAFHLMAS